MKRISYEITESLRIAFAQIRANLLRSLLTICGVAVGVFSIITVMTVMGAMDWFVEKTLTAFGANSFMIQKYPPVNFTDPRNSFRNRPDVTVEQAERLRQLMGESAKVNILRRCGRSAFYKDRHTAPNMRFDGSDENYMGAYDYTIAQGRNMSAEDVALGRPVCVIGDETRIKLFPDEDPIGALIRVGQEQFTVIGVFNPKGAELNQSRDSLVLVPLARYRAAAGKRIDRTVYINVQAPDRASFGAVQDRAIGAMRLVRRLAPEDPNNFEITSNDLLIETATKITAKIALGALGISAIALLAAGVGVMNIMFVSVTDRTREIGVRKSVGAKKTNILVQFLLEAVVLTLIGGLLGILLGVTLGNTVILYVGGHLTFPWNWTFLAMFVCGMTGVFFGIWPAWKASSLNPVEALRYE